MEEAEKERILTEILEAVEEALIGSPDNPDKILDYDKARKSIKAILEDLESKPWDDEEEFF